MKFHVSSKRVCRSLLNVVGLVVTSLLYYGVANGETDSLQRKNATSIIYAPSATFILGLQDSSRLLVAQCGFGVSHRLSESLEVHLSLPIGIARTQQSASPFASLMLTGELTLPEFTDRVSTDLLLTIGTGGVGATFQETNQIVGGMDLKWTMSKSRNGQTDVLLIFTPGYGHDFSLRKSGIFLNLGFQVGSWMSFSFDFGSLLGDNMGLINMGRLR